MDASVLMVVVDLGQGGLDARLVRRAEAHDVWMRLGAEGLAPTYALPDLFRVRECPKLISEPAPASLVVESPPVSVWRRLLRSLESLAIDAMWAVSVFLAYALLLTVVGGLAGWILRRPGGIGSGLQLVKAGAVGVLWLFCAVALVRGVAMGAALPLKKNGVSLLWRVVMPDLFAVSEWVALQSKAVLVVGLGVALWWQAWFGLLVGYGSLALLGCGLLLGCRWFGGEWLRGMGPAAKGLAERARAVVRVSIPKKAVPIDEPELDLSGYTVKAGCALIPERFGRPGIEEGVLRGLALVGQELGQSYLVFVYRKNGEASLVVRGGEVRLVTGSVGEGVPRFVLNLLGGSVAYDFDLKRSELYCDLTAFLRLSDSVLASRALDSLQGTVVPLGANVDAAWLPRSPREWISLGSTFRAGSRSAR